jgi:hypothetical protein
MLTLVMSYTAVFCLTRGDKLSGIKDNELFRLREFANNLGVNIPGTDFLNGVIIKYSKGYKQISKAVFDDLLEKCKTDGLMDSEVTLRYLDNRYRDHRPTSPRSGDLSEPAFNTVSTNNFAVRDNGSIYTFTQYSCHVLVFCGPDGMGWVIGRIFANLQVRPWTVMSNGCWVEIMIKSISSATPLKKLYRFLRGLDYAFILTGKQLKRGTQ